MPNSILIIDNDIEFVSSLSSYLETQGYKVSSAQDGEQGLKKALNQMQDLIIMDIVLPKLNGFEVLKKIREQLDTPVFILTSRDKEIDKIISLEIGADDYLPKPCNPQEVLSRLKAILRRTQKAPVSKPIIQQHNVSLDCSKRLASLNGTYLELTNAEFNILEMLIKSPGQAFSKEELTEYALGRRFTAYDRSIDVHISNLRNKLGENAEGEALIKTVRGFGYLFNV